MTSLPQGGRGVRQSPQGAAVAARAMSRPLRLPAGVAPTGPRLPASGPTNPRSTGAIGAGSGATTGVRARAAAKASGALGAPALGIIVLAVIGIAGAGIGAG